MSKGNYKDINSINSQSAPSKNSIKNEKPDIIKNANVLDGYFANSVNGGMIKTLCYAPIMAGTKGIAYKVRLNLGALTPKTPNYQQIKCVLKCFFVPNSRVWKNWEKFDAQIKNATSITIEEEPNIGGLQLYTLYKENDTENGNLITDTDLWRDSWISSYLPRYQTGRTGPSIIINNIPFPKTSILPIRGFRAIYNDYLRNKEYDTPLREFDTDSVSDAEWYNTIPNSEGSNIDQYILRGRRQDSYYTNYRTNLLGQEIEIPNLDNGNNTLVDLVEYEKYIAEARSEAENAQLNPWDVIAKIHGSKKLTEGKVQLLGTREFPLNFNYVAQDTYNTNDQIEEQFQTMGQLGAYSYTEIDATFFQGIEFKESGYIHIIAQITSDSVFETGFNRTELNVKALDKYRPDLVELKHDVLYEIEKSGTRLINEDELTKVTGFKRKFSEYFKLPNSIAGDMTTGGYYQTKVYVDPELLTVDITSTDTLIQSKRTFQMFETDDKETGRFEKKNIWQDYTDINYNRNQAIMQEVLELEDSETASGKNFLWIRGENQFYLMGMQTLIADLPIDENIKKDYKTWGEK